MDWHFEGVCPACCGVRASWGLRAGSLVCRTVCCRACRTLAFPAALSPNPGNTAPNRGVSAQLLPAKLRTHVDPSAGTLILLQGNILNECDHRVLLAPIH